MIGPLCNIHDRCTADIEYLPMAEAGNNLCFYDIGLHFYGACASAEICELHVLCNQLDHGQVFVQGLFLSKLLDYFGQFMPLPFGGIPL